MTITKTMLAAIIISATVGEVLGVTLLGNPAVFIALGAGVGVAIGAALNNRQH